MDPEVLKPWFKPPLNGFDLRRACNLRYWNLLQFIERSDVEASVGSTYLRALDETRACDAVSNLSHLRSDFERHLWWMGDDDLTGRIRAFEETHGDKRRATQAFIHYKSSHRQTLLHSLSWPRWVYYWTWHKAAGFLQQTTSSGPRVTSN